MHRARSVFLWAIVAIFEIVLITLPVSLQAQLIAGISVVTLMGVIKILNAQGTWRLVSLALGTASSCVTSTGAPPKRCRQSIRFRTPFLGCYSISQRCIMF